MTMPTPTVSDIVRDHIREFPGLPNLTRAKTLAAAHPGIALNLEAWRTRIRDAVGAHGDTRRKNLPDKSLYEPLKLAGELPKLPRSYAEPWRPYQLRVKGKGLVIADAHIPYHDRRVMESAVGHSKKNGAVDFVVLLGDWMDFYQISFFSKHPDKPRMQKELTQAQQSFQWLRHHFGDVPIVYKLANHEFRWTRYLLTHAVELVGIPQFELKQVLNLAEFGIEPVMPQDVIMAGKHLMLCHGDEFANRSTSQVNPARGLFLKALSCSMQAHCHRRSDHDETAADGTLIATSSIGCCCGLHPEFARINKWNWGFAMLSLHGNDFEIDNKKVLPNYEVR